MCIYISLFLLSVLRNSLPNRVHDDTFILSHTILRRRTVHYSRSCLVHRENEGFSNVNVRGTGRCPDYFLRDVLASQGLEALIDALGSIDISPEADDGELGLYHTRLYFGHTDGCIDQLSHHGCGERVHGVLRGGIDAAANVWLAAGDGTDLDDMPGLPCLEISNEQLGHRDEPEYVGGKHAFDDGFIDFTDMVSADNISCIVNEDIDVSKGARHLRPQAGDRSLVRYVELDGCEFAAFLEP